MRGLAATGLPVLHGLDPAAFFCDRSYLLHERRVVATRPPAEVPTEEMLGELYGVRTRISVRPTTGAPSIVCLP